VLFVLAAVALPTEIASYGNVIDESTQTPGHWDYANEPLESPSDLTPNGTWFSGAITSHAVLQKGSDVSAALYGGVGGGVTASANVTLIVAEKGSEDYTVTATILSVDMAAGNLVWKAMLKPHAKQGGSIAVTAQCSGCSDMTTSTLTDLTYGDVWFCSGQSNSA
jgi:hypothetical protein